MINRNVLRLQLQPPPDAPPAVQRTLGPPLRILSNLLGCGDPPPPAAHTGGGPGGGGSGGANRGGGGGGGPRRVGPPPMLTKTLEWNLRWCILDPMFDERFRIRPEFMDVAALRRRELHGAL